MGYERYNHQGYFGECFVRVLASAAGLIAEQQDVDATGVDFSLCFPGSRGTLRYPKIEAQVKSWGSPRGNDAAWNYSMRSKHFNAIAGTGFQSLRYLFLVIVPSEAKSYTDAGVDALLLRHCGYWTSLADYSLVDETSQQSVAVHVPKSNRLTVQTLLTLLDQASAGRVAS